MAHSIDLCAWPAALGAIAASDIGPVAPCDTSHITQRYERLLAMLDIKPSAK